MLMQTQQYPTNLNYQQLSQIEHLFPVDPGVGQARLQCAMSWMPQGQRIAGLRRRNSG
jgi:hypothetical protein